MSSTSRGASKGFIMCVLWRMSELYLQFPDTRWPLPVEAATRVLRAAKEDMKDDAQLDALFGGTKFSEKDTDTYWTQAKSLATFWKNNLVRRIKLKKLLEDAKSATGERGNLARVMSVAAMNLKAIVTEGRKAELYMYPFPCPEYLKKRVSSMRVGPAGLPSADLIVCNTPAGSKKSKGKGKSKSKGWGAGAGAGAGVGAGAGYDDESSIASLSSHASRSTARSRSTRSYYEESESESDSDMDNCDERRALPLPLPPPPARSSHRQHLLSDNACAAGLLLQLHHCHQAPTSLDDDLLMPAVQEPLTMRNLPDSSSKIVPDMWGAGLSPFNMHIVTQGEVMMLSSYSSPLSTHTHNALTSAFLNDMDVEPAATGNSDDAAAAVAEGLLTLSPFAQDGSARARTLPLRGMCSPAANIIAAAAAAAAASAASAAALAAVPAAAPAAWVGPFGAYGTGRLRSL